MKRAEELTMAKRAQAGHSRKKTWPSLKAELMLVEAHMVGMLEARKDEEAQPHL